MTNPLTDTRTRVATVVAGLGVSVHAFPPSTPSGPFITIVPADPWLTPRGHVSLGITVNVPTLNNQTALERLEQTVWDVLAALQQAAIGVENIGSPTIDQTSQLLRATVTVVTRNP